MLSQHYSRYIFWGLFALVPITTILGWSTRQIWGTLLVSGIVFTLLFLDALGGWHEPRQRLPLPLLMFAGLLLTATLVSTYAYASLIVLLQFGAGCAVFSLAQRHGQPAARQQWISAALIAGGAVSAAYAVAQTFQLKNLETGVGATFIWKNTLAGFLTLVAPLALTAYLGTAQRWLKVLLGIALAMFGTALYFTNSQAAWLATAIGGVIVIWGNAVHGQRSTPAVLKSLIVPAALTLTAIVAIFQANARLYPATSATAATATVITTIPASSIQSRLSYWATSWEIVKDFPLLGVGPGNFATWYAHKFTQPWLYVISPHNYLVYLAVTAGIPATIVFLWFVLQAAVQTRRWLRHARTEKFPAQRFALVLAWAAAGTCLLLHSLLDLSLEVPAISLLWWLVLGLLYANLEADAPRQAARAGGNIGRLVLASGFVGMVMAALFADNYYQRAFSLQGGIGQAEERLRLLEQSRRLMPWSADTIEAIAVAHWDAVLEHVGDRQTHMDAALTAAQSAVALDPAAAHRHWVLGRMYSQVHTPQRPYGALAIAHLQQAIAYDFHDPGYYRTLAEAYLRFDLRRQARQTIDAGLALYPPEEISRIVAGAVVYEQFGLRERLEQLKELRQYTEPKPN
ncbi:MAG: O-antigen ligase family protein [Patescibacteria group bacterium]|nr:O-antigen ligase family protein [Patescibacteria group bacterium]